MRLKKKCYEEIFLLNPEKYDPEKNIKIHDNYFEDTSWESAGWINNILGTNYSIKHRFRIWDVVEKYALSRKKYSEPISNSDIRNLFPKEVLKYVGGTELTDVLYIINGTESLTDDEVKKESYPADVLACKNIIKKYL